MFIVRIRRVASGLARVPLRRVDLRDGRSVALAVWLFLSMFVFTRAAPATFWNNVFVAFFVFELSISDSRRIYRTRERKGMAAGDSAVQ